MCTTSRCMRYFPQVLSWARPAVQGQAAISFSKEQGAATGEPALVLRGSVQGVPWPAITRTALPWPQQVWPAGPRTEAHLRWSEEEMRAEECGGVDTLSPVLHGPEQPLCSPALR